MFCLDREGDQMLYGPLLQKLEALEDLSEAEKQAVISLCNDVRSVDRRVHIITEGAVPSHTHIILSGWAARYKLVPDGGRRITAILLPGDFCDIHTTALARMDHSILAITRCQVAFVETAAIDRIACLTPALTRTLRRSTLVDEAILRQWLVNAGRRNATDAVAHLLSELHLRMNLVGLAEGGRLQIPLTQEEIGDSTGLTPVHVNRVIGQLRDAGLLTIHGGILYIPDVAALHRASGFDQSYLHLRRSNTDCLQEG